MVRTGFGRLRDDLNADFSVRAASERCQGRMEGNAATWVTMPSSTAARVALCVLVKLT